MDNILSILTDEEKSFISQHGIDLSDIYDARGENYKEYHGKAKAHDCHFVIYNKCHNGHRLRTRSGHCIMCRPVNITFQNRESGKGIVYIAKSGRYCKVGMIENNIDAVQTALNKREYRLNSEGGYGEIDDWKIVKSWVLNKNAGKIERTAHSILDRFKVEKPYWYSGEYRTTNEMFKCALKTAEEAVITAIENNK